MRIARLAAAVAAAAVLVAPGGAASLVDVTGASLAAGAAPVQGTVTVDGAAGWSVPFTPAEVQQVPGLPGFTTPTLPTPSVYLGTGPYFATSILVDTTLPGGTYDYSSFVVGAGATLTFTGPVILRVKGDVSVDGTLRTVADGATIEIRAYAIFVGDPAFPVSGAVTTAGAGASIALGSLSTIEVLGTVAAASGDVVVAARSDQGPGAIRFLAGSMSAPAGAVQVTADDSVAVGTTGAFAVTAGGEASLRAVLPGAISVANGSSVVAGAAGPLVVESNYGITVHGGSDLHALGSSTATLSAGDYGALVMDGGSILRTDGGPVVVTGNGVSLAEAATIQAGGPGSVHLLSVAGLGLGASTGSCGTDSGIVSAGGDILLECTQELVVTGPSSVVSSAGDVTLRSPGYRVRISGDAEVRATAGTLVLEAFSEVLAGGSWCNDETIEVTGVLPSGTVQGGAGLSVSSFAGNAALGALAGGSSAGSVAIRAPGTVRLLGTIQAFGDIEVRSVAGGILAGGASLATLDRAGSSGSITLVSFGGAAGPIDAAGATMRTGDSDGTSGDILLQAFHGAPPPFASSWFVPSRVDVQVSVAGLSVTSIDIAGEVNGGAAGPPGDPLAFRMAETDFSLPLVSDSGGVRTYGVAPDWRATVKSSPTGSSRYAVVIHLGGPIPIPAQFFQQFNVDKALGFSFTDGLEGSFRTVLDLLQSGSTFQGLYDAKTGSGELLSPGWLLQKAAVASKGAGKDAFTLVFLVPGLGEVPAEGPDLSFHLFDASFSVPGSEALRKKSKWTWKSNAGGSFKVTADYAKGTVTVKGKKATLGTVPPGPAAAALYLALGADLRWGEVRLGVKGKGLAW